MSRYNADSWDFTGSARRHSELDRANTLHSPLTYYRGSEMNNLLVQFARYRKLKKLNKRYKHFFATCDTVTRSSILASLQVIKFRRMIHKNVAKEVGGGSFKNGTGEDEEPFETRRAWIVGKMGRRRDILSCIVVPLLLATLPEGGECRKNSSRGPIQEAIESGAAAEYNKEDCTWRRGNDRDSCPDPDVHIYLYTPGHPRRLLGEGESDWLRQDYEPTRENILLIHGYAGGDDSLPIAVLRDAYMRNGSYNVFLVDWGALSAPPCYPAAVANIRPVARCLAATLTTLRHLGMPMSRTTCVGHSLGAHVCGIMANYLLFRMHKIIGLDPARPLVRPGLVNRLDSGDADFVQVIHTNAGYYGEIGRAGHVDFCVNGGRVQPFCENRPNDQLCSHVWVVCYMAQSIDGGKELLAEPCTRRCPTGPRISSRAGEVLQMGQQTPDHSRGSFCYTGHDPPYCPKYDADGRGDQRCCL